MLQPLANGHGKGFVTKPDYLHLATTNPDAIKKLGLDGTRYTPAGGPGRRKSFAYHNEQKRLAKMAA